MGPETRRSPIFKSRYPRARRPLSAESARSSYIRGDEGRAPFKGMPPKGETDRGRCLWDFLRTHVTAHLPSIFAPNPGWNRSRGTVTNRRAAVLYKSAVSHPLVRALPSEARRVPTARSES